MTTKLRPEFCLEKHLELLRRMNLKRIEDATFELHDSFPISIDEAAEIAEYYFVTTGAETE